jgi:hypothetical protein
MGCRKIQLVEELALTPLVDQGGKGRQSWQEGNALLFESRKLGDGYPFVFKADLARPLGQGAGGRHII